MPKASPKFAPNVTFASRCFATDDNGRLWFVDPQGMRVDDGSCLVVSSQAEIAEAQIAMVQNIEAASELHKTVFGLLQKIMTELTGSSAIMGDSAIGHLTPYGAGCMIDGLGAAGFEIVRAHR